MWSGLLLSNKIDLVLPPMLSGPNSCHCRFKEFDLALDAFFSAIIASTCFLAFSTSLMSIVPVAGLTLMFHKYSAAPRASSLSSTSFFASLFCLDNQTGAAIIAANNKVAIPHLLINFILFIIIIIYLFFLLFLFFFFFLNF